jgi:hypothetical protein
MVADRTQATGVKRRTAYLWATVIGIGIGVLLDWLIQNYAWHTFAKPGDPSKPGIPMFTWPLWRMMEWLMFGGFAVFLHAQRRATLATTARLRAAELNRLAKSREMLEARLKVMQARVEPQFLFNTLAQVRDLYRRDVVLASVLRASRMLDDLIVYLRAAVPRMRDTSSTAGQEVTLARAYLDLARRRLGDRVLVKIEATDEVETARMPPMMLLPLIDHALVRCSEHPDDRATVHVAVRREQGRLAVSVIQSGGRSPAGVDANALTNIRERLAGLYGTDARLVVREATEGTIEARLEFPLEFVPATAPIEIPERLRLASAPGEPA